MCCWILVLGCLPTETESKWLIFMSDIRKTCSHLQSVGTTAQNTGQLEAYSLFLYKRTELVWGIIGWQFTFAKKNHSPQKSSISLKKSTCSKHQKRGEDKFLTSQVHFQSVVREIGHRNNFKQNRFFRQIFLNPWIRNYSAKYLL